MRRPTVLSLGLVAISILAFGWPQAAGGAYGDGFGIAPSLGPALPGPTSFWAGTCSRGTAPAIGVPIAGDGVGARPPSMIAKRNSSPYINPSSKGVVDIFPSPLTPAHCIDHGAPVQGWPAWADDPAGDPVEGAPQWRLESVTQAGSHPDGSATFTFDREPDQFMANGSVDNISVDLPAGFLGDPGAVSKCTNEQFDANPVQCPATSQVGIAEVALRHPSIFSVQSKIYPVYNIEAREGVTAEFGIPDLNDYTPVRVVAKARTNGDFGVTTAVPQIPAALDLYAQTITLWGVPWAASNDKWRVKQGTDIVGATGLQNGIPQSGLAPADQQPYDPSWGPIRPFVSTPTECSGASLETRIATDAYQNPGAFTPDGDPLIPSDPLAPTGWFTTSASAPPVSDCDAVDFDGDLEIQPTSTAADSASGIDAELRIPQNDDPPASALGNPELAHDPSEADGAPAYWRSAAGRAASHLNRAVVTLPPGVTVNPAGATGLAGCSDDQIGVRQQGNPPLFNNQDPFDGKGAVECPEASKIGTVEVVTPLLEEPLDGVVVLGTPKSTDPRSGEMLRMFIVVRSAQRGLIAKIAGSAVADPVTGQLTATFDRNPRVPFETMQLRFKGGEHGLVAMPQRCGAAAWSSQLTPWSAPAEPLAGGGSFAVGGDCDLEHAPTVTAGVSDRRGGADSAFSFRVSRSDGQQWLRTVTARLPQGLIGAIRNVPLCSAADAAAGSCPDASRIGFADAAAGSGSPFYLERKGDVYLTEGYRGAPFGLMVRVRVEAGPFRGPFELTPIVVRQALEVDPDTAEVRVVSDPLPSIWHGIPLRTREVTVTVDRPAFVRNPTDCSAKRIGATIGSTEGTEVERSVPFRATDCGRLPFRPKLAMRLSGRRQMATGGHPVLRARVTQGRGQANIEKVRVALPTGLALDSRNAYDPKLVCDYDAGLAANCPASSIIGRAHLETPVLRRPLTGPVHLVQGIRFGPSGNRIRTLPTLLVKLDGEVRINLRGKTSTDSRDRLVSTFADVPDAPASSFAMRVNGGTKGIVVVTRTRRGRIDLCRGKQVAIVDADAQNGRRYDRRISVATACGSKKAKPKRGARPERRAKRNR